VAELLRLDGSEGEGGGQILRSALALSVITRRPFEIFNIRARRKKPGLRPQHLACVKAAAKLSRAELHGATIGSTNLRFVPRDLKPGSYRLEIGTAGSTALLLHTLYLPLALAGSRSVLTLGGGTHAPFSPSFHYLERQWAPFLGTLGIEVELTLASAGYYPEGGGEVRAKILPARSISGLRLTERGELERLEGISGISGLPRSIAHRQRDQALRRLRAAGLSAGIEVREFPSRGKGTFLLLLSTHAGGGRACYCALGARGKRAERVADEACDRLLAFLGTAGVVDEHLADQLLLPLALAREPSEFTTPRVTGHLVTNARVIERFVDARIVVHGQEGAEGRVEVWPASAQVRVMPQGKCHP